MFAYVFKNLNLPVSRTNFASNGKTFVVFNRAGNEYEFTFISSSLPSLSNGLSTSGPRLRRVFEIHRISGLISSKPKSNIHSVTDPSRACLTDSRGVWPGPESWSLVPSPAESAHCLLPLVSTRSSTNSLTHLHSTIKTFNLTSLRLLQLLLLSSNAIKFHLSNKWLNKLYVPSVTWPITSNRSIAFVLTGPCGLNLVSLVSSRGDQ